MNKLSVVIITFNEEKNIKRCLESVKDIADEIIVVDSFSTDNTEQICTGYNLTFIQHPFEGHIQQKNYALELANNDLVLSLDADEALSEKLKKNILRIKENTEFDGYTMNRMTNYCGKWIRHGTWYPDTKLRLAKKNFIHWGGENPHDKLIISSDKVQHLKGDILHYSYYTIEGHLQQQQNFSSIAAEAMFQRGKRAPFYKLIINPMASWIKDILFRFGFLDGKSGFIIANISAKSVYWKYSKLRNLWSQNKGD
jgi:glycosyltransferase involved in cell wall biosynthesis